MNQRTHLPPGRPRNWPATATIAGLLVLAVFQLGERGYWTAGTSAEAGFIREGHDLSNVSVRFADGGDAKLASGLPTLLLVFDPECAHSERVAGAWAKSLSNIRPGLERVLAVAPGPLAVAVTYARDKRWPVDVGTVQSTEGGLVDRRILQRTPWVFALDEEGRVIREGHGSRLREVARSLGAGSVERETADPAPSISRPYL
ncbi:MAG: hypothetical protein OXK77_08935 [Gemmatimonadota bacterium]|nr:hypothetical protein [Gemmatimonadota bacterium]MDE2866926.1 hypothetical protein [Gemmatimonadota bacterium]